MIMVMSSHLCYVVELLPFVTVNKNADLQLLQPAKINPINVSPVFLEFSYLFSVFSRIYFYFLEVILYFLSFFDEFFKGVVFCLFGPSKPRSVRARWGTPWGCGTTSSPRKIVAPLRLRQEGGEVDEWAMYVG